MKFKGERIDLFQRFGWTTNAGDPLWVEVPLGVTEGFVFDMAELRNTLDDGTPKDPGSRMSNLALLDQVTGWNWDGRDGKPLPLTRDAKTEKARLDILAQMPISLFGVLAEKMLNTPDNMTEKAEDFSKTSSEA